MSALLVSLTQAVPALADPPGHEPAVVGDRSTPVHAAAGRYRQPPAMPKWQAAPPAWPSGDATVDLTPSGGSTGLAAGKLPIRIGLTDGGPTAKKAPDATTARTPVGVHVQLASRQAAAAAGVNGVLVALDRTVAAASDAPLHVSVDYGSFADAFGGDWGARLRLTMMPACALKTPTMSGCTARKPLPYRNNTTARTLSADVTVPPRAGVQSGTGVPEVLTTSSTVVLAADTSGGSGGGGAGDFTATSLRPSGSWQAGGSSDGFSWSYPISVPNVPGGLAPKVALSYSSQSVDGLTSSTNNQASWIGDGWQYNPGFIERAYQSCHDSPDATTKSWDECWSADNQLTLSLNGSTTQLIRDDATGKYHPADDANEKVEYLTGASNGAHDGEYFQVTSPNGTRYVFGLNQLPGWAPGNTATNSAWTEPVFSPKPGEPCYNPIWSSSWCQQAYRWNLDEVIDTHGDAITYFYKTETNYYARNLGPTADTPYIRGGYLWQINYGQRDGSQYTGTPAAQVTFSVNGRCDSSPTGCDPSTLSTSTASHWPDVPYDLNCAQGASCSSQAPTFWSEYELTGIQTQAVNNNSLANVDSWAFAHSFPATGEAADKPQTAPALWLNSITRTGQDAAGAGPTDPLTLPPIVFSGTPLVNRVSLADGYPGITRQRLNTIVTETGQTISVDYSQAICATCAPAESGAATNTAPAFPDYWTRPGETDPRIDWFNKYVVTHVTQQDATGSAPPGANDTIVTSYTPIGTAAWHYDDNPLTPAKRRTWNQWRGYQGMIVSTGTAPEPVTKTVYTYMRGMDGDSLPGGSTRHVTIPDSRGDASVTDSDQFAGMMYEAQAFNGNALVTDTINDPWTSPATASHALSGGLPVQHAFHTGRSTTTGYTPLASGATRQTRTQSSHDSLGRVIQVNDQGDTATTDDDLCTTTSYADNTTTGWLLDHPAESRTISVDCATNNPPASATVADKLTFYDNSTTLGGPPSVGDATMQQQLVSYTGATPNYVTTTVSVDQYGRAVDSTDGNNNTTHTSYSPNTGAQPSKVTITDPIGLTTATTYDPLRQLPLTITDPATYVTSEQYDTLGRLTAVYKPGRSVGMNPNQKYAYTVSNTAPSTVTAYTLTESTTAPYRVSETIYDSMLRARELQTQTPNGGRLITDTNYNTDGWLSVTTNPYYNSSAVSTSYVEASHGDIDAETGYLYDAAGRQTDAIAYNRGSETWRTSYLYGGNYTTTIPPAGATRTTSVLDARGHQTHLIQYHAGAAADYLNDAPTDYSDTTYTYTPSGHPATLKDPAGNTWAWSYDLLGHKTDAYDPDTGHTAMTYDNMGNLLTTTKVTDSGKQTTYTYDNDNRKTRSYDTTGTSTLSTANQIGAWTYDTVKPGRLTSVTSYSAGDALTSTIQGYNPQGLPTSVTVQLTGPDSALVPTAGYTTSYGYSITGRLSNQNDPAEAGLPQENLSIGADAFGEPTKLSSTGGASWTYVSAVGYNEYGQPLRYTMPTAGGTAWASLSYDPQTRELTEIKADASTISGDIQDTTYTFGNATVSKGTGLLTSVVTNSKAATVTDDQCYTYDDAERLTQAWSATDNCAATPQPGNSPTVGGPTPYWQSWTYNSAGMRATETDHATSGSTDGDTTTSYHYPASTTNPQAPTQPHTLTSTTGPAAAAAIGAYTYDASGNASGATLSNGKTESYTWNNQGKLATTHTSNGTTTYVYDAEGNEIARRDPGTTTLYLGDAQLTRDTTTGAISGTRYYTLNGATIACRTSSKTVLDLIPDRQGTTQLAIDTKAGQAITRRQYLPFGQARGNPAAVPGDKGWIGGSTDPATDLVNLGAREYDAQTGRFLSADPVLEADDPNQLNGYDYAGNNPSTHSDPSGLRVCVDQCGGQDDRDARTGYSGPSGCTGGPECDPEPGYTAYPQTKYRSDSTLDDTILRDRQTKTYEDAMRSSADAVAKRNGWAGTNYTVIIAKVEVDGEPEVVAFGSAGMDPELVEKLQSQGVSVYVNDLKAKDADNKSDAHAETAARDWRRTQERAGKTVTVKGYVSSNRACSDDCADRMTEFSARKMEKDDSGFENNRVFNKRWIRTTRAQVRNLRSQYGRPSRSLRGALNVVSGWYEEGLANQDPQVRPLGAFDAAGGAPGDPDEDE